MREPGPAGQGQWAGSAAADWLVASLAKLDGDESESHHYDRGDSPLGDVHRVEHPVEVVNGFGEVVADKGDHSVDSGRLTNRDNRTAQV